MKSRQSPNGISAGDDDFDVGSDATAAADATGASLFKLTFMLHGRKSGAIPVAGHMAYFGNALFKFFLLNIWMRWIELTYLCIDLINQ